jgi:hypothetical protein
LCRRKEEWSWRIKPTKSCGSKESRIVMGKKLLEILKTKDLVPNETGTDWFRYGASAPSKILLFIF